jgi:hypothetical protein
MPRKEHDGSHIVSVRLPAALILRLDRYLDWSETSKRVTSSRNAALREALSTWLDAQEQRAGFLQPQALRPQFQAACHSVDHGHDWVPIHRLRQLLQWPRERFAAVVEELRAAHAAELDGTEPGAMSDQAIQDSYQVHGHLYLRLRWCD